MDRRIYDMLEKYKQKNSDNTEKDDICFDGNFCIDTDFNTNTDGILTMAFVNMQPIESIYKTDDAFPRGTIFPNIDKPFFGGQKNDRK